MCLLSGRRCCFNRVRSLFLSLQAGLLQKNKSGFNSRSCCATDTSKMVNSRIPFISGVSYVAGCCLVSFLVLCRSSFVSFLFFCLVGFSCACFLVGFGYFVCFRRSVFSYQCPRRDTSRYLWVNGLVLILYLHLTAISICAGLLVIGYPCLVCSFG